MKILQKNCVIGIAIKSDTTPQRGQFATLIFFIYEFCQVFLEYLFFGYIHN